MARYGQFIEQYSSTRAAWLHPWNTTERVQFEQVELPQLRQTYKWGYGFSSRQTVDAHLFMFHGFKPVSEAGKASFFRFEWPWFTPYEEIFAFAAEIANAVPFLSGTGGYILQARPYNIVAYDYVFAKAQRYWGLEAWNLDRTVEQTLSGYKCPSWLTLIGNRLVAALGRPSALDELEGYETVTSGGIILRSRHAPDFIDRNSASPYAGEHAIAAALEPLQIQQHAPFGGNQWDEDNTLEWLRRFS